MTNENIREAIPIMSPDSLRASLDFLKKFNDTHPKRNTLYTDTDGNKFVGTTENLGDEILIESRKLILDKSSLKKVFEENTFSEYFDIGYSELIENREQQNMMVALLKDKVFSANKTYQIIFSNCKLEKFIRAKADGLISSGYNYAVINDEFYVTEDCPKLMITDTTDSSVIEYDLKLKTNDSYGKYMWHKCASTDLMVDSITEVSSNNFSVIINLDHKWKNLPFVWYINDYFKYKKDLVFEKEFDIDTSAFMNLDILPMLPYIDEICDEVANIKVGTDSQGLEHLYVDIIPYEETSVYNLFEHRHSDEEMFIRCYAYGMNDSDGKIDAFKKNPTVDLRKFTVELYFHNSELPVGGWMRVCAKHYSFNNDEIKVCIDTNHNGWADDLWKPAVNDNQHCMKRYDIDGSGDLKANIVSLFNVYDKQDIFDNESMSGIHISTGTEYNNHSIIKDTGNIHDLDKFDGLPKYFGILHDRTMHKSHIDLYSIRGLYNDLNQGIMDKQTAGIILDSGIPQTEIITPEDMPVSIYYDGIEDDGYIHRTNEELVTDERNCLTDTVYVSEGLFGNAQNPQHATCQKFVYHGNGYFSLGIAKLDPEYEYARVYAVTNDPIKYLNNLLNPRPARTLARICDIPTDFHDLIREEYNIPHTLFDPSHYVVNRCSYKATDLDTLINKRNMGPVYYASESPIADQIRRDQFIFPYSAGGPGVWWPSEDIFAEFGKWTNFDNKADLTEFSYSIEDDGSEYSQGDTFYIMIGGLQITGTVDTVSAGGNVTGITLNINSNTPLVSPYNIETNPCSFEAISIDGNGTGLIIELSCSDEYYNSLWEYPTEETQEVQAYMYDDIGNIWLWTFDYENRRWIRRVQVTGETDTNNVYDEGNRRRRSLGDALIHNIVRDNKIIDEACIINRFLDRNEETYDVTYEEGYDENEDISSKLSSNNIIGGVYTVAKNYEYSDKGTVHQFTASLPKHGEDYANEFAIPVNNELNLSSIYNVTNKFLTVENNNTQPDLYLFFPNHSTKSKIPTVSFDVDHGFVLKSYAGDITYSDILYQEEDGIRWINPDLSTISNIYHYNEYAIPDYFTREKERLSKATKDVLRSYCNQEFGLTLEDSKYMQREELYTYAITHFMMKHGSIYKRDGIKLDQHIHDKVQTGSVNANPVANGPQPIGEYMSLTQTPMNIDVRIDTQNGYAPPIYFFELEDDTETPGIDESLRVYDDYNNDISLISMIIKKIQTVDTPPRYERYIFRNNKWIKLIK